MLSDRAIFYSVFLSFVYERCFLELTELLATESKRITSLKQVKLMGGRCEFRRYMHNVWSKNAWQQRAQLQMLLELS